MSDTTFAPPPIIPPDTRKHSRIGLASFVISIVAAMIFCLAFLLAFGYGFSMAAQDPSYEFDQGSPFILTLGLLMCISPFISMVGLGLGIGAMVQKTDKKLFGIIGLVVNLVVILTFCILASIGLLMQSGNLG